MKNLSINRRSGNKLGEKKKLEKKQGKNREKNSKSFRDQILGDYGARKLDAWLNPFNLGIW